MITRRRNHKSTLLAVFCVLMAGLITLASCASPALSIVVQEAGNRPEAEYQPGKSGELEDDRIEDMASLESDDHAKQDVYQASEAGCGSVTLVGPGGGGWIASIAIAPTPPGSVYVGSDVGGVYKSTNDGENWVIENNGLTNYDIRSIAFDPQNPSVVYVATTGGVFKSTDGGENWLAKRNGFPDIEKWSYSAPVSALAVDPDNPDILYAGIGREREESHGQGTIYKSVDGGENWFIVNTGPSAMDSSAIIHSIAIDPSSTSTLYTGTDKGLYKSTDGGANWIAKNDGLPVYSGETAPTVRKVIVNPLESSTLYVTVRAKPNTDPWQGGVYKSTDGGESWVARSNGLANYAGGPDVDPMTTSNYRDMVIDPNNPETLYVGDFSYGSAGVYKTTDGGNSWVSTTNPTGPNQNMDLGWSWANSNVWSLAIDPSNPSRLYFGTGMALFKTGDGGDSWSQAYTRETESGKWQSIGFEHTGIWDIAVDTTNPDNVYAGYVDIGFLKSTDGGTSFQRSEIVSWHGGNVFAIAIDPDSPNIIYAGAGWWETNSGWVVKSTDYGESWTVIGSPSNGLPDAQVHSIAIDPTTPVDSRTLYVTSQDHGVYKSVDGGQSWVSISSGIGANLYVRRLVMDPNDPDLLYVGIRAKGQTIGGYGGIYKTTDGGESWTKANKNIELPDVYALVVDPSDSSILHAGTHNHYTQPSGPIHLGGVYRSIDGGENWQAVLASEYPFNIGALAISPVNPDVIFAGAPDYQYHDEVTGAGIFRSTDGGQTWHAMNEGLPMLIIYALTAHPTDPDIVYAGTSANGLFRIVVPQPASLVDLTISPPEIETGDTVAVSVLVTNAGDVECTYQVQLTVDGSVEESREITLAGGDSQTVAFTTATDVTGSHTIDVNGLSATFTVKPPPAPAAFTTRDLTISPTEVDIGETVTIGLLVANTGDLTGSHKVTLEIDSAAVAAEDVILAGGDSQTVTFTTARDVAGVYSVTVDALSGTFTVKAATESLVAEEEEAPSVPSGTPQPVAPTPAKPTNWPVLGGLVGGAIVVVTLLVYFLALRRRST